jgi:hypothetical protein
VCFDLKVIAAMFLAALRVAGIVLAREVARMTDTILTSCTGFCKEVIERGRIELMAHDRRHIPAMMTFQTGILDSLDITICDMRPLLGNESAQRLMNSFMTSDACYTFNLSFFKGT